MQIWSFSIHSNWGHSDTVQYGHGETERQAIFDLATSKSARAVAHSTTILGGKGGWILTDAITESGRATLWVHHGEKLDTL